MLVCGAQNNFITVELVELSRYIKHLVRHIRAVQERYLGIRVHLHSGNTDDLAEQLDRGLLDFAVIAEAADLS